MRMVVLRRSKGLPVVQEARGVGTRQVQADAAVVGQQVEIIDGVSRRDMAEARRDPEVEAVAPAMPVRLVRPAARNIGLLGTPAGVAWGVEAVGAVEALADGYSGSGAKVAVLDTGIDVAHPAFSGIRFDGSTVRNFTGEGDEDDVRDTDGHGTHCAGTIFGRDVEGVRIGVAPGVTQVLIAKVIGRQGGTFDGIADAVHWAYVQGAHILSMSLGMDFDAHLAALQAQDMPRAQATSQALVDYGDCLRLFDRLCNHVADPNGTQRSMLVIAAAGNESERPHCVVAVPPPAGAFGVVPVAAIGRSIDRQRCAVAPFSNRGANCCAPGMEVVSAAPGGGLATMDGTSMAAPHVAGVAALWAQSQIAASRKGIVRRDLLLRDLYSRAVRLGDLDADDVGCGLVMAPRSAR